MVVDMSMFAPHPNLPLHKDDLFWSIVNTEIVYFKPPVFISRAYQNAVEASNSVPIKAINNLYNRT